MTQDDGVSFGVLSVCLSTRNPETCRIYTRELFLVAGLVMVKHHPDTLFVVVPPVCPQSL